MGFLDVTQGIVAPTAPIAEYDPYTTNGLSQYGSQLENSTVLEAMNALLTSPPLDLPYQYFTWTGEVPTDEAYWTGDIYSLAQKDILETGEMKHSFYLTGHYNSRESGSLRPIESKAQQIEDFFRRGVKGVIGPGISWVVRLQSRNYLETGIENFFRVQVVLTVYEWKATSYA